MQPGATDSGWGAVAPAAWDLAGAAANVPAWSGIVLSGLLLTVLVILSAGYSGSEPILFSLTRTQLQHNRLSHNPLRRMAASLMENPKATLTVILLGNTAVNVLLYATVYVFFEQLDPLLGIWAGVAAAVFSTLLVSIACEAIPKTLGVSLADRLVLLSAPLIHFSSYVLGPLGRLLDLLVINPLNRLLWGAGSAEPAAMSTVELKTLLETSRREGAINPLEDALLREVIDLGHLRVRDVMVPRVEVRTYDLNAAADGLRDLMRETRLKKIPVYDGTFDNIVGLIYAKVLFLNPGKPLRSLVQAVHFVPELATCEQLLHHFRSTRSQLAIAVDEYGGMGGLVTLEDVLEAIVGDLPRRDELPEPEIVPIGHSEFEISGSLGVHYWVDAFRLPPVVERVATVGGLVNARLGRPAQVDDVVTIGPVELRVTRVQGRRINRLRLRVLPDGDAPEAPPRGGAA
jgi:putative hemolysin